MYRNRDNETILQDKTLRVKDTRSVLIIFNPLKLQESIAFYTKMIYCDNVGQNRTRKLDFMKDTLKKKLRQSYIDIYKDTATADELLSLVEAAFDEAEAVEPKPEWISEKDTMLITYGDSIIEEGKAGLEGLTHFLKEHVGDSISTVHLLPMFPYTSDDGFSVVDYYTINPALGDWSNIEELSNDYNLMFDAVINHISRSSEWFQKFLAGEAPYDEYFIKCDPEADYSSVTRPRALPLLTEFETNSGKVNLWTTFSTDQIDLNFRNIRVYVEVLKILMNFAARGARFIRLDAVGFIWKELGTSCSHRPETHEIIKTYRAILEEYSPGTLIITETNVPHEENISYFGNGDEAQLVYQFPLPPLTMFSILSGNAAKLSKWADSIGEPQPGTTFFNFLSSHDGIGVRPTEGILDDEERQLLVDTTLRNGGRVSYKFNGDGSKSPYELNINYQDALAGPDMSDDERISRFLAAETILLSMQGLPGIYIHSLIGSRNDYYGMTTSDIPRRINREKIAFDELSSQLRSDTNRRRIFDELIRRIDIRKQYRAFSPTAHQKVLLEDERVFTLVRYTDDGQEITVYVNVSSDRVEICTTDRGIDLISGERFTGATVIEPYQCVWMLKTDY